MSKPLCISELRLTGNTIIGITSCPGRNNNLEDDLNLLEAWGADAVISLVEHHEFSSLGVPGFETAVKQRGLRWYHLPITDMEIPGCAFINSWNIHGREILQITEQGGRIVIHCAGGLGRSGMIAAKLMTAFDVLPSDAINRVRKARPGAIETREQEDYVLNGPVLAGVAI